MADRKTIRPIHGGNLTWAAEVAGCSPDSLIDFSASISPLGPPATVLQALQDFSSLAHYPDPQYQTLRQALGEVHGVSPDWVLPGNGAAELLTWACRELAELEQTWLLTPGFGDYFRALNAFSASIHPCSLLREDQWEPSLTQVIESDPHFATAALARQGCLINNPHNPSGLQFDRVELRQLASRFGLMVVDEAFMDFLPPSQQHSLIDQIERSPNLVIIRSLTKFYSLPGLRLGYAIAHPDRLQRWQQWRDPWPVNSLAAAAALAAMQDAPFQQRTWDWLTPARHQLYEGLAAIPGLYPLVGSANFLLVRSDHPVSALQRTLLERRRILIRDCLSFPELGDRYFRVAVRTEAENAHLIQALDQVIQAGR